MATAKRETRKDNVPKWGEAKAPVKKEEQFCGDVCVPVMQRFIEHMEGVESIDVEEKKIAVVFDEAKVPDKHLIRMTSAASIN